MVTKISVLINLLLVAACAFTVQAKIRETTNVDNVREIQELIRRLEILEQNNVGRKFKSVDGLEIRIS